MKAWFAQLRFSSEAFDTPVPRTASHGDRVDPCTFLKRNPALKAYAITLVLLGLSQLIALVWFHPRPVQVGLGTSQHGEYAKDPIKSVMPPSRRLSGCRLLRAAGWASGQVHGSETPKTP